MPRLSDATLKGLRASLAPECAGLPALHLQGILDSTVAALPEGTTEDFLSTLGSVGKAVLPALQQAAPSVAQGAASGAALGPWGALIGAGAGLASSLIKGQSKPPKPAQPSSPPAAAPVMPAMPIGTSVGASTPSTNAAPALPRVQTPVALTSPGSSPSDIPGAATVAVVPAMTGSAPIPALPSGQAAAATLLSLIQNPAVLTALLSQALGSSGNPDITTPSGQSVPRGAINSLLTQLLSNASDELPEAESISEQKYLRDAAGEYLVDPACLDQLGALVLIRMHPVESPPSSKAQKREPYVWLDAASTGESVTFF